MRRFLKLHAAILLSWFTIALAQEPDKWTALFNGSSLDHWQTSDGKRPTEGWAIEGDVLHRVSKGGDLLTKEIFGDFELEFEWKIGAGANSGVKYRFGRYGDQSIGIEYQLIDDASHDTPKGQTGALYEIFAPNQKKKLNAPGEFNHSRIVAKGNHVEHWLNGEQIIDADLNSDAWKKGLQESKFRKALNFGQQPGRLLLQDHGGEVWFRNIRVRKR